jgi:hypothetical protein
MFFSAASRWSKGIASFSKFVEYLASFQMSLPEGICRQQSQPISVEHYICVSFLATLQTWMWSTHPLSKFRSKYPARYIGIYLMCMRYWDTLRCPFLFNTLTCMQFAFYILLCVNLQPTSDLLDLCDTNSLSLPVTAKPTDQNQDDALQDTSHVADGKNLFVLRDLWINSCFIEYHVYEKKMLFNMRCLPNVPIVFCFPTVFKHSRETDSVNDNGLHAKFPYYQIRSGENKVRHTPISMLWRHFELQQPREYAWIVDGFPVNCLSSCCKEFFMERVAIPLQNSLQRRPWCMH